MRLIWLAMPDGGQCPVNPDQVQYLRMTSEGATALVFGAVAGGLHQLVVAGDGESVAAALEGPFLAPAAAPTPKPKPPARPKRTRP
jgi:hypothetical protein